ncbi:pyrolysin [Ceratobasidium sp. AG-Ba]|nr:pyrolysin [Ceratobasidium sp. AG-Ba]
MKVFVAVAAAAQLVAAAVDIHSIPHETTGRYVPGSYLVGTNGNTHFARGFASAHAELEHDLEQRGVTYTVTKLFSNSRLWKGVVVRIDNHADLLKVAQAPGVTSINRNYLHDIPKRPEASAAAGPLNPIVVDKFSTHQMTGVNRMHGNGIFGKGITIGIIDTGIDYTHPALGGKFGPGNKVIGGYDFVGDAYTGKEGSVAKPDNDPLDQCNGHGTHVAGIIGANPDNPYNVTGVAYQSSINAYRVFGCTGSVADDVLIASMNKAFDDGNDIITMSLGGPEGWSEGVTSVVASKIAEMGRVITIAAGNDGDYGSWYASGPATGINAISVGSVENVVAPSQNATDSTGRQISYYAATPIANGTFPVYVVSTNASVPNDACNPLPDSTPDLSPYVVVIRRGGCAFTQKLGNAANKGGKLFLVSDNVDEDLFAAGFGNYTAAMISKSDGDYVINLAKNNGSLTFSHNPFDYPTSVGGLMSTFSTYGPSFDMYLKPALSAPGGNIISTWPVPLGSYKVESGTSMATPFMAGAAALYMQVKGKTPQSAKDLRAAFQNTASYIPNSKADNTLLESLSHAGAGLIQVYAACFSTSSMLPAELLLNDTANFAGSQSVKITNKGTKAVTYTITHVPAGTTKTIDGIENILGPVPHSNAPASVTINPSSVTIQPGQSANVALAFTPPTGLDAKTFPVYSGFIQAKGSDNSVLHSSYLGVAAALKDMKVVDNTDMLFGVKLPIVNDKDGNPISGPTTYSMNGSDTPAVIYRLVAGSPLIRIDLIDSKSNVTTNQRRSFDAELDARDPFHGGLKHTLPHASISKRGLLDFLLPKKLSLFKVSSAAAANEPPTLGNLYSEDYVPRNALAGTAADNGFTQFVVTEFANGTAIPNGSYKILLRAKPIDSSFEESWASPEIIIKRS